jgi:hypothetical protein
MVVAENKRGDELLRELIHSRLIDKHSNGEIKSLEEDLSLEE